MTDTKRVSGIKIAMVSGKGGSGKTLVTAAMMLAADQGGVGVTLVDGDAGTGGLSYYLALNYLGGVGAGLADLVIDQYKRHAIVDDAYALSDEVSAKPIEGTGSGRCFTIGDHRALADLQEEDQSVGGSSLFAKYAPKIVDGIALDSEICIIDCRGGIDQDSIALCQVVDDWPAPGSEDTRFGVRMGPEVGHGASEVYAGVQA